jgi:hypothetical protein
VAQILGVCESFGISKRLGEKTSLLSSGQFQSVRAVTPPASMAITQHP